MQCKKCGFEVRDNAFCPNCRNPVYSNIYRVNRKNENRAEHDVKNKEKCKENYKKNEEKHDEKHEAEHEYKLDEMPEVEPEEIIEDKLENNYQAACEEKSGKCRTATDDEWYCRKDIFIIPLGLLLIRSVAIFLFINNSILPNKNQALIVLFVTIIVCAIMYCMDIRWKRRIRFRIHIVEDILITIMVAFAMFWLSCVQKNTISYINDSYFPGTEQTVETVFEDTFENIDWYCLQYVDGITQVYVSADYRNGKEKHKIDIMFVCEEENTLALNKNGTIRMTYVGYDGVPLEDYEISELLGFSFYSDNNMLSNNGDGSDRFSHDIEAVKSAMYAGSSMTYEEAFYNIFTRCQWTAYDGMAYTPDDNYNGKWDSVMAINDIVEFTGSCNYGNEEVQMRFQFTQDTNGHYRPTYLEINSVPQDSLTLEDIIQQLCLPELYVSDTTEYDYAWFPCGVFGKNERSEAEVTIEYLGNGEYAVDIGIYRLGQFENLRGYMNDEVYGLYVEGEDPCGNYISFIITYTNDEMAVQVDYTTWSYLTTGEYLLVYMYQ